MKLYYSDPTVCPMCDAKTTVKYSLSVVGVGYRRNRTCMKCGYKFRTVEILEEETEIVKEKFDGDDNV